MKNCHKFVLVACAVVIWGIQGLLLRVRSSRWKASDSQNLRASTSTTSTGTLKGTSRSWYDLTSFTTSTSYSSARILTPAPNCTSLAAGLPSHTVGIVGVNHKSGTREAYETILMNNCKFHMVDHAHNAGMQAQMSSFTCQKALVDGPGKVLYDQHFEGMDLTTEHCVAAAQVGKLHVVNVVREPYAMLVSAYDYHRRGSEGWTLDPALFVNFFRDLAEKAVGMAGEPKDSNATIALETATSYADFLSKAPEHVGVLTEMLSSKMHICLMVRAFVAVAVLSAPSAYNVRLEQMGDVQARCKLSSAMGPSCEKAQEQVDAKACSKPPFRQEHASPLLEPQKASLKKVVANLDQRHFDGVYRTFSQVMGYTAPEIVDLADRVEVVNSLCGDLVSPLALPRCPS